MEPATLAREILDGNVYLTLGTADASGRPWVSPVYYATEAPYHEIYWVSAPSAVHSRNITVRPEVSMVVFDSRAEIGGAQAVYMTGVAEQVSGLDLPDGIDVFSRASVADGASEWSTRDVREPAPLRLYRARVDEHSVLDAERSSGIDQRERVTF
jgi:hypothetical protein